MARTLAVPAARFFRTGRSVNLLISASSDNTSGIVEGMYQSPILVQWQHAPRQSRVLHVSITEIRSIALTHENAKGPSNFAAPGSNNLE